MEVHLSFWTVVGVGFMFAVIVGLFCWCINLLGKIANR